MMHAAYLEHGQQPEAWRRQTKHYLRGQGPAEPRLRHALVGDNERIKELLARLKTGESGVSDAEITASQVVELAHALYKLDVKGLGLARHQSGTA